MLSCGLTYSSHPVSCAGLFSVIEFVKDKETKEPLAPFNGTCPEMARLAAHLKAQHVYAFSRFNLAFHLSAARGRTGRTSAWSGCDRKRPRIARSGSIPRISNKRTLDQTGVED